MQFETCITQQDIACVKWFSPTGNTLFDLGEVWQLGRLCGRQESRHYTNHNQASSYTLNWSDDFGIGPYWQTFLNFIISMSSVRHWHLHVNDRFSSPLDVCIFSFAPDWNINTPTHCLLILQTMTCSIHTWVQSDITQTLCRAGRVKSVKCQIQTVHTAPPDSV